MIKSAASIARDLLHTRYGVHGYYPHGELVKISRELNLSSNSVRMAACDLKLRAIAPGVYWPLIKSGYGPKDFCGKSPYEIFRLFKNLTQPSTTVLPSG